MSKRLCDVAPTQTHIKTSFNGYFTGRGALHFSFQVTDIGCIHCSQTVSFKLSRQYAEPTISSRNRVRLISLHYYMFTLPLYIYIKEVLNVFLSVVISCMS